MYYTNVFSEAHMKPQVIKLSKKTCPDCGHILIPESGCFFCRFCGYSLCTIQ